MQKGGKGFTFEEPAKRRKGFSLVEVVMVVLFIGILAAIAIPRLNFAVISKHKAEATAKKIVTDLRLTHRLAISDAANNTKGFEFIMLGANPYTGYEIENSDTKATVASHTIDSDVSVTGAVKYKFKPLGNLQTGGDLQLTVSAESKSFTITVLMATGVTKCVGN
jgi:prepilin-type N-terminal cleavage/methylation domain-containing protein